MAVLRFLKKLWFVRKRFTIWDFGLRHVSSGLGTRGRGMEQTLGGRQMPKDTLKKGHSGAKKNSFHSFLCNLEYIYLCKKYKLLIASLYALGDTSVGYDELKH